MGIKNEIEDALAAHAAWRKHFKDYLNGRAAFNLATAGSSDCCKFGQWLNREGHRLMPPQIHGDIRTAHDDFHRIAAEIIQRIKQAQFAEVLDAMAPGGAFNQASEKLASLLHKASLRDEVAGKALSSGDKPVEPTPNQR